MVSDPVLLKLGSWIFTIVGVVVELVQGVKGNCLISKLA